MGKSLPRYRERKPCCWSRLTETRAYRKFCPTPCSRGLSPGKGRISLATPSNACGDRGISCSADPSPSPDREAGRVIVSMVTVRCRKPYDIYLAIFVRGFPGLPHVTRSLRRRFGRFVDLNFQRAGLRRKARRARRTHAPNQAGFVAQTTSPCTGTPASVRNSAGMIFDCRPEAASSCST
jgi:hypothetical protein